MKFLHLGDLHIGKSLYDFHLYEDQKFILDQIVDIAVSKAVDAVLIAGDVYDKSIPSEEAVKLFDYFLKKLVDNHLMTFVISGNHDSDERLHFGSTLFEASGIYISSKFDGTLYKKELQDEAGAVNVYLLPFVKASQVKHFYPETEIHSYEDAVSTIIEAADIDVSKRNILVSHQFVVGASSGPVLSGSESNGVKNVGTIEMIHADCMKVFDYVALGHIHGPQSIGADTIRYSGSPLKYSLSEVDNKKSVPIVTLQSKGQVEVELVELQPMRELRHIKGRMEVLLSRENVKDTQDYIYVTLTDEDIINNAMSIIQQQYPRTVKIDYDNSHTKELENQDITAVLEEKSFTEIISEFYMQMYGREISEQELAIISEVAIETGV